ncbi:MAG: hypothetical protein HC840_16860 [Leptolyngbyaceae cyanobacterium RM2_2_4]|nr:hypothetical protein [Leptolyngbyaceae cyanobacterium RM2_2_4]
MGTRSHISVEFPDKTYKTIYCHWDGYPSHNGVVLHNHYGDFERAKSLVEMGDMSFLDITLEKSTFYHRDRQEDLNVTAHTNWDELQDFLDGNYHYVFDYEKKLWLCDAGEGYETIPDAVKTDEE